MTEFRSPPEEVARIISELESLREAVRVLAGRVSAMDKHLRRIYQIPKTERPSRKPRRERSNSPARETVLRRFDDLRSLYVGHGSLAAEEQLKSVADEELRDLVRELGIPNSRKASTQRLRDLVMQRLRESSLLGVGSVLRGPEENAKIEAAKAQTADAPTLDAVSDPNPPDA